MVRRKKDFENKLKKQQDFNNIFIKNFNERIIMVSDTLEIPTLDNLWNYLNHFYEKIPSKLKNLFSFEDLAGIYIENGLSGLFAVCIDYVNIDGLKVLPSGRYLCSNCTEENKEEILSELVQRAKNIYSAEPKFIVQLIVVSGILQWNYEIQVYIVN